VDPLGDAPVGPPDGLLDAPPPAATDALLAALDVLDTLDVLLDALDVLPEPPQPAISRALADPITRINVVLVNLIRNPFVSV
jgi:hypothetical protein